MWSFGTLSQLRQGEWLSPDIGRAKALVALDSHTHLIDQYGGRML
jgi:hypothetical protein